LVSDSGVSYVSDARASNPEALRQALHSVAPVAGSDPNVWLIAGGPDDGYEYHDLGPLLSRRVKRAFLLGEAAQSDARGLESFYSLHCGEFVVRSSSRRGRHGRARRCRSLFTSVFQLHEPSSHPFGVRHSGTRSGNWRGWTAGISKSINNHLEPERAKAPLRV
jgi:hypothetical protein